MFKNRMLAVAAVLVMAVPAFAAAGPVVAPPAIEQLVEGHTVFTVIEVYTNTTTTSAKFAAAVAVLVREYQANNVRFPGVLWFNDQYLVSPNSQAKQNYRYPCGGAVMAVNAGDPDPRLMLATQDGNKDLLTGAEYGNQASVVDLSGGPTNPVLTTVTGALPPNTVDYEESYWITDPNDHAWLIDKYVSYSRTYVNAGALVRDEVVQSHPVWVVNMLGTPAFIPDDGTSTCSPYYDLLYEVYNATNTLSHDSQTGRRPVGLGYPVRDNPPGGYDQPSKGTAAQYCYNGNPAPTSGCARPQQPIRQYNALLYFKLEDLTVTDGSTKNHADPRSLTDTNGCEYGTEWQCPGDNDNAEGNSHVFHPTPGSQGNPAHTDGYACPVYPQTSNHGGSNIPAGQYDDCNQVHVTRQIDVYFSGAGRPFPPVQRVFDPGSGGVGPEAEGSNAPFHCYPNTPCAEH